MITDLISREAVTPTHQDSHMTEVSGSPPPNSIVSGSHNDDLMMGDDHSGSVKVDQIYSPESKSSKHEDSSNNSFDTDNSSD